MKSRIANDTAKSASLPGAASGWLVANPRDPVGRSSCGAGTTDERKESPVRSRRTIPFALAASAVVLMLAVPAGAGTTQGLEDPIPGSLPHTAFSVSLQTVADGFNSPTSAAVAPGIDDRLFVTDQTGKIWSVDLASGERTIFANL